MSVGTRPATCTSCGKRLNRKQWYYRNGKYFCKKRCWVTESEKVAKEAVNEAPAKEAAKPESSSKETPASA